MISRIFLCGLVMVSLARSAFATEPAGVWTQVNDDDPAATYSPGMERWWWGWGTGVYSYFRGDMHVTQKAGEWASFTFIGTGVKWIGGKNTHHGEADVYIDGKFDATVSSTGPTQMAQQVIYMKTGLSDGPHTMKIVVKTANFVDFDAFAFYGPAPRTATMPTIDGVTLPPQQPLLNVPHRYPVGNGVAVAICGPVGQIETVFGPGYTTSDLLGHEDILVDVDGTESPLRIDMKRAAGTGVFYGVASLGDIDIGMVDFTGEDQPWISRLIVFKNTSPTTSHSVVVRDNIVPLTDHGYKSALALDAAGHPSGFAVQADTSTGVPYGGNNPVDKSVVIAFNDPAATAALNGTNASLQTESIPLPPGAQHELTLTHYFRSGHDLTDAKALDALRALDTHANLQKSIADWTDWIGHVAPAYALSRIKDARARVLVEGALVILKTNQSQDGGIIAHTTWFKEGYVRDAAMAVRGLLATGHTEEAKEWLLWIDKKLSIDHHLADAMNCSTSLDDKSSCFDVGNMNVEEPGWVLLCARDYYTQTHDLAFLKGIDRTLRYCADIQLKEAAQNGDNLTFNGDETEICGAVDTQATGIPGWPSPSKMDWSLSSVAMAAASVDFYIDYLKATGGDPANYRNSETSTTMDLNDEVKKLVVTMDREFWRTDVPESPAGFHDFFRAKADGAWPKARDVNFTLMPVFFSTPYAADEKAKDVAAIAQLFNQTTGFLPLVPSNDSGMEGHDLGYLLWGCVETDDWHKDMVYEALVNGPTVDCWGSFNEAYDPEGHRNGHDLRSLETGVNVSALAKYWGLGSAPR
jgi:hypothetical protein